MKHLVNVWRLLRPWQWVKSGFVFVGLLFAKAWREPLMLQRVLLAALAFSLVSSGVYVFNDLFDRKEDRLHPRKSARPLAAGTISVTSAVVLIIILWGAGFLLGWFVSPILFYNLLIYVVINVAYSMGLKTVVVLDVFIIAAGFMLRILAGTVGVGIAPSQWLILCGLMMALFLGFTKRRAELYAASNVDQRKVLRSYQPVLLDQMIVVTATCVILTYSLYTMSPETIRIHGTDALIYTVPFVMYGVFRYLYALHNRTGGEDPTVAILRDPHVLAAIAGWLFLTLWLITNKG